MNASSTIDPYAFENPWVAQSNAAGLGILSVTGMLPVRQTPFPQGDGLTPRPA